MPAVFIQTHNGTVTIIRDLTQEEAERAVDVALDGPRHRAEAARQMERHAQEKWIARLYFGGNPHVQEVRFYNRWNGYQSTRHRDGSVSSSGFSVMQSYGSSRGSEIIRAEVI